MFLVTGPGSGEFLDPEFGLRQNLPRSRDVLDALLEERQCIVESQGVRIEKANDFLDAADSAVEPRTGVRIIAHCRQPPGRGRCRLPREA